MNFDAAFKKLLVHEGGYVDSRGDPGGETKYGISKRSYPLEDIKGLTEARAAAIYRRDFWGPAGCDALPDTARFQVFDMAVHSGVGRAIKTVQKAVDETQDGVLGPRTLQAVQSMHPARFVARFNGARILFEAELPTWPAFSRGWMRRNAMNLLEA